MERLIANIFRYDPSVDAAPRYETYNVPYSKGMRVLDVLQYAQSELDPTIAFKYSCSRKRCGSCSVTVNGKPVLACFERAENDMNIEPLHNFPIVRDLVVDTGSYEREIINIHPFLERVLPPQQEPEILLSSKVAEFTELHSCIQCFCCVGACPVYEVDWKSFGGPALLVESAKLTFDPRDEKDRLPLTSRVEIEDCVSCYSCVHVCPMEIDVLGVAIEKLKGRSAVRREGPWAKYGDVFIRLVKDDGIVTPSALFLKTRGSGIFTKLPFSIKMGMKGKISIRRKRIPKLEEVRRIYELTEARP